MREVDKRKYRCASLYDAEAVHSGMQGLVLKVLKLKSASRHPPQYLAVCCVASLCADVLELTRTAEEKRMRVEDNGMTLPLAKAQRSNDFHSFTVFRKSRLVSTFDDS